MQKKMNSWSFMTWHTPISPSTAIRRQVFCRYREPRTSGSNSFPCPRAIAWLAGGWDFASATRKWFQRSPASKATSTTASFSPFRLRPSSPSMRINRVWMKSMPSTNRGVMSWSRVSTESTGLLRSPKGPCLPGLESRNLTAKWGPSSFPNSSSAKRRWPYLRGWDLGNTGMSTSGLPLSRMR